MNIFEKLLGNLKIGFDFLNRKNSATNNTKIKGSSGVTVNQINGDVNNGIKETNNISNIEKLVLNGLYQKYIQNNGKPVYWKTTEAHRDLGIKEGTYIGVLHDSNYVKLDGEKYTMTNDGIRYMDSLIERERPRIDLKDGGFSVSGSYKGSFIHLDLINNGGGDATDIKFNLVSEEYNTDKKEVLSILQAGKSRGSIDYKYDGTPFYKKKLTNPKIIFYYKDKSGNSFYSGRRIKQDKKDDDSYRLHSKCLDYFEGHSI